MKYDSKYFSLTGSNILLKLEAHWCSIDAIQQEIHHRLPLLQMCTIVMDCRFDWYKSCTHSCIMTLLQLSNYQTDMNSA